MRTSRSRVAAAAVALAAVGLTAGCSDIEQAFGTPPPQPVRDDRGAIVREDDVDPMSLRVGDCVDLGDELDDEEVWSVHVVPCDDDHTGEVYASSDLTDASYPGEKAVIAAADEFCYGAFERFVGVSFELSALYYATFYPSAESWEGMHDRELLCIIEDPSGVSGTLAKSQR